MLKTATNANTICGWEGMTEQCYTLRIQLEIMEEEVNYPGPCFLQMSAQDGCAYKKPDRLTAFTRVDRKSVV